ncbi:MAG: nitrophenyl compound nitroreductase subunit ArsF family protein [Chitinophagales bacterium]
MKTSNIALSLIMLLFFSCSSEAQTGNKQATNSASNEKIEVIQFHSENRCRTCLTIEELARQTVENYSDISFSLVNVDDKANEEKADAFEAFGTALFLYNPETGAKKELTDFAFMNAGNKEKFIAGLQKEIDQFIE